MLTDNDRDNAAEDRDLILRRGGTYLDIPAPSIDESFERLREIAEGEDDGTQNQSAPGTVCGGGSPPLPDLPGTT